MQLRVDGNARVTVRDGNLRAENAHTVHRGASEWTVEGCRCGSVMFSHGGNMYGIGVQTGGTIVNTFGPGGHTVINGAVFAGNGATYTYGRDGSYTVTGGSTCGRNHPVIEHDLPAAFDSVHTSGNSSLELAVYPAGVLTVHASGNSGVTLERGEAASLSAHASGNADIKGPVTVRGRADVHASGNADIKGIRCAGGGKVRASGNADASVVQTTATKVDKSSSGNATAKVKKDFPKDTPLDLARLAKEIGITEADLARRFAKK